MGQADFAVKDLAVGTEILFDYGDQFFKGGV
jgi:hypothetical protein